MESPVRTKNLSVSVPKDVHSIIEGIVSSFSPTLDLSKRGLEHLSEEIFKISHLKQLHLQRNELSIIPKDFFQLLPNLVWLDLRHNKIKAIPSGIGSHKNLKTLLMEKNPIKALPVELGNLMSLKALNLRNCPLEFPPPQVIHKGLPAILAFLRAWALEHSASLLQQEAVPMQKANSVKELSGARSEAEPPASAGEDSRGKDYHFPLVERLNLAGVTESSPDLSEDVSSDEGMKQFWQLRQEIVAAEKADILSNQLPLELQNRAKEHLHKPKYSFRPPLKKPYNSRKKTPSSKSIFPEIPSHETQIQIKKDEEKHLAALKELKEKQALIEQRKREKTMLQKWRQRTKGTKKKEVLGDTRHLPKDMVVEKAPFATQPEEEKKELEKKKAIQLKVAPYPDERRTSKDREIEERIKHHMEALRQRRRKARGAPREETARKLHEDAPRPGPKKEYRFTAFTGEVALQSPMCQPQNIFSNMKF
ncbi:leucine-rich repeat-containing protein 27 isoform X2 [Antechinus flavipes]|uniref:leucine-rich repeat-containing protein 27 isoform X2 n=1 Tax=Antechinus flavipes TaxID=38775 RepID=UPI002236510A|nr:leucine-rich repeat-containing protein 27 isoform X2 [Antechinus flavipes]